MTLYNIFYIFVKYKNNVPRQSYNNNNFFKLTKTTNTMKKNTYVSPEVEVAYMVIEQGIAASANGLVEDIYLNEEDVDW